MTDQTKTNIRRWILSSAVTFFAAFAVSLLAQWDGLTIDSLSTGAAVGIVFTAIRAGIKALLEGFLLLYNKRKKE